MTIYLVRLQELIADPPHPVAPVNQSLPLKLTPVIRPPSTLRTRLQSPCEHSNDEASEIISPVKPHAHSSFM